MHDLKLLLVDDEDRFLKTTQKLLTRIGYDIRIASSGTEALALLAHHAIHVVVLDVKMPGMDGIATLKEIKRRFPLVEVIMLTGHATVDSAIEGLQSGATDYLMKPVDPEILIEKALSAFLKRKHMDEKIRIAKAKKSVPPENNIIQDSGG
ncbi:MAG: response regulator [Desulfobacterales bacterium]|jgi:DNA-binding NtrC family response regulator|nr:response regulator [Desulfobacterales bacterium]